MTEKKDKPEGYVFGRPTKYKKEYCEQLIEWMREGRSFWTFASTVPCTIETLSEWCRVHPEFSEAKRLGRVHEQKWWDDLHRKCSATGEGNSTMIVWAQKNKFPKYYKERLAKGTNQINLNASMDIKQLVANMKPEQIAQLISVIEEKTLQLEEKKE